MNLDEFYDYKNQLMGDLLTNPEIIKLLDDEYRLADDPASLIYKQIYPFEYIPDTIERGQTFICCDVDIQKPMNKTFCSLCCTSGCLPIRASCGYQMVECARIGCVQRFLKPLAGAAATGWAN